MNIHNCKIFNKGGSSLNLFADSYINLEFRTDVQNARGAEAYVITDTSALISGVVIKNGGYEYDPNTEVYLDYTFDELEPYHVDSSIIFKDVSIFNPDAKNSSSIGDVSLGNIETVFIYPSVTYSSAIFLDPVSEKLVETEHLAILESSAGEYIRPYDPINPVLIFRVEDGDEEIMLFDVNEEQQEVIWSEEQVFDISEYIPDSPLMLNIGFRSEEEGVFERKLRCYHYINGNEFLLWEVLVNAQSIGEDERLETLQQNFGLPEPKNIPHLFKEANINEALPDWELLNYKGKHLVLEHQNIMPYIGTYKGLINAIKWLGYEDIKIKEWFKNVKEHKKLSLDISYEASERVKTILALSAKERRHLKKLNELSLVYCITRETGELDRWGTPITENCYEYNLNEVLIKLHSLKSWLEKNIIGVNARIISLDGEGVYFEVFKNILYSTQNFGSDARYSQSLTPLTIEENSELVQGDASINLSLKEFNQITVNDLTDIRIIDFANYGWDPSNGQYSIEGEEDLDYTDSSVIIGSPFFAPFPNMNSIRWQLSLEKSTAGVISEEYITNPLFIYKNTIRFYNIFDTSAIFHEASTNLTITIDRGYLRDPSVSEIWGDSLVYKIEPELDESNNSTGKWLLIDTDTSVIDSSTWGFFSLFPYDSSGLLQYAYDDIHEVPLFTIRDFRWTDAAGSIQDFGIGKQLHLELIDGNIGMTSQRYDEDDPSTFDKNIKKYINFEYDTSLDEQTINLNVVYDTERIPIYVYDASIYYDITNNKDSIYTIEDALKINNKIRTINVNHIGDYNIEIYGFDGMNNIFWNVLREPYKVWTKYPTIISYAKGHYGNAHTYLTPEQVLSIGNENLHPIFDVHFPLRELTLEYDEQGEPYIKIPSISYFIPTPTDETIAHFYNLTEKCTSIDGTTLYYNSTFQSFYEGDDIKMVMFDKGEQSLLDEASTSITNIISDTEMEVDNIPVGFETIHASSRVYLLNDTHRSVSNIENDRDYKTITCDISMYTFLENQVVALIIEDTSLNYWWGASHRVIDVSGNTHVLEGNIPEIVIDNSRFKITAKHGFSTYTTSQIDVSTAYEIDNNFHIYLDDKFYQQYHIDSTFVYSRILFDEDRVITQWFDPVDTSINKNYFGYKQPLNIEPSTLIILESEYDPSNYMLNQQNIWTITKHTNNELFMRVFNKRIPYVFEDEGIYHIDVESYDSYGNLVNQTYEGLIKVKK